MSYSNGIQITYKFAGFAGISTAGQSAEKITGPEGKTGRLVALAGVVVVANTAAAGKATLRDVAASLTFGSLTVPIASAEDVANALVIDDVDDSPADASVIPADTALELNGDGLGTNGTVDIYATIEWS